MPHGTGPAPTSCDVPAVSAIRHEETVGRSHGVGRRGRWNAGRPSPRAPSLSRVFGMQPPPRRCSLALPLARRVVSSRASSCCCAARPTSGAGSRRSSSTGPPATPTSPPCAPTSARRCATSRSCATTRSATWAAGCASPPRSSTTSATASSSARSTRAASRAPTPRASSAGASDATLTPEEQQALAAARTGKETRVTRFGYLGPEGTFTSMALDAWDAGRRAASACRSARSTRRSPPCAPATSTARWCRSRTPSRAASPRPSTRSPAATRSSSPARCSCRSPSCSCARPGTPLADVRAVGTHSHAWAQVRGWMGEHLPGRRVRADAVDRGRAPRGSSSRRGSRYDAGGLRPGRRADCTGSRCSPTTSATTQAAVTRFVLVARPGDAARADRRRQDDGRALPARRPRRWPARAARAVRRPRRQHDPARVAADRGVDGVATASRSTSRATCSTSGSARR